MYVVVVTMTGGAEGREVDCPLDVVGPFATIQEAEREAEGQRADGQMNGEQVSAIVSHLFPSVDEEGVCLLISPDERDALGNAFLALSSIMGRLDVGVTGP